MLEHAVEWSEVQVQTDVREGDQQPDPQGKENKVVQGTPIAVNRTWDHPWGIKMLFKDWWVSARGTSAWSGPMRPRQAGGAHTWRGQLGSPWTIDIRRVEEDQHQHIPQSTGVVLDRAGGEAKVATRSPGLFSMSYYRRIDGWARCTAKWVHLREIRYYQALWKEWQLRPNDQGGGRPKGINSE